jgi:hypothetical protein
MSSNRLAATHTLVISSNLVHNMLGTKKGEKNKSIKVGKERKRERKGEKQEKECSKGIKEQQHYICCGCWKVMLKVETLLWISISLLFVKNHFLLHRAMDGHHLGIVKNLTINQNTN